MRTIVWRFRSSLPSSIVRMGTYGLEHVFRPNSVTVIGGSPRERSVGRAVLRNLRDGGFAGPFPVCIRQDAYALLGLMACYDFAPGWNATLNIDNVTDEKYIPSLYWEQDFYGAPRSVSVSLGYRF